MFKLIYVVETLQDWKFHLQDCLVVVVPSGVSRVIFYEVILLNICFFCPWLRRLRPNACVKHGPSDTLYTKSNHNHNKPNKQNR